MLTKRVYDDAKASNLAHYFKDHIRQADDGPFFLDVFRHLKDRLEIAKKQPADTAASYACPLRHDKRQNTGAI